MKVIALHIWIRRKRPTTKGATEKIVVVPTSQAITAMKLDIAKTIKPIEKKIVYYYVVVVVRRPDGKHGYRTVVPKQLVAA